MNAPEMMRLMGINPSDFTLDVTIPQVAKQIGNAMSLNVIERIIYSILPAAGFGANKSEDRWVSGSAIQEIKASRNKGFRGKSEGIESPSANHNQDNHEFILLF